MVAVDEGDLFLVVFKEFEVDRDSWVIFVEDI